LRVIRIGTSGALQEDIPIGSLLVSNLAVGFDNLMNFYDLPMDDEEAGLAHDIQKKTGLPFMPYVVRGSESLMKQIAFDMPQGNTVTCPGFYAPQGRVLRAPVRFPNLLEVLNYYHKGDFWLTNFEMETAGYYAMARLLGHEALSVNAILANRIKNKVVKNPNKVVESLIERVLERI
jgi:uridine phosphorylase